MHPHLLSDSRPDRYFQLLYARVVGPIPQHLPVQAKRHTVELNHIANEGLDYRTLSRGYLI